MDRTAIAIAAGGALGAAAVLRQRREAAAVRAGVLRAVGPDGQPDDLPTGRLYAAVAGFHPAAPTTLVGRLAATVCAAPLTLAGVLGSLLGGVAPRLDRPRSCLVARGVGGPFGFFLRGQGADAATLGQVVLARGEAPSPRLLDHEAVHVRQQERLGLAFALAYPVAQAVYGYRRNPFEVAARTRPGER